MTTASAPCGIGAPVMMRAACPERSCTLGLVPAGIAATSARLRGCPAEAPATSDARTAKPSTDELSKRGSSEEMISAARTRPIHRSSGRASVSTGWKWLSILAWAAATLSNVISGRAHYTTLIRGSIRTPVDRGCASAADAVGFGDVRDVLELGQDLAE